MARISINQWFTFLMLYHTRPVKKKLDTLIRSPMPTEFSNRTDKIEHRNPIKKPVTAESKKIAQIGRMQSKVRTFETMLSTETIWSVQTMA
jgi:hypothetical protein